MSELKLRMSQRGEMFNLTERSPERWMYSLTSAAFFNVNQAMDLYSQATKIIAQKNELHNALLT